MSASTIPVILLTSSLGPGSADRIELATEEGQDVPPPYLEDPTAQHRGRWRYVEQDVSGEYLYERVPPHTQAP